MVCVLQSKLPRSSAVFQLYCKPFFFPSRPLTFYTFLLLGLSFATALLTCTLCFLLQNQFGPFSLFVSAIRFSCRWYAHVYSNACLCTGTVWLTFRCKGLNLLLNPFDKFPTDPPQVCIPSCLENANAMKRMKFIRTVEDNKKQRNKRMAAGSRKTPGKRAISCILFSGQ